MKRHSSDKNRSIGSKWSKYSKITQFFGSNASSSPTGSSAAPLIFAADPLATPAAPLASSADPLATPAAQLTSGDPLTTPAVPPPVTEQPVPSSSQPGPSSRLEPSLDIGLFLEDPNSATNNQKYCLLKSVQIPSFPGNKWPYEERSGHKRYLRAQHFETNESWLAYSHEQSGLFCKVCVLFAAKLSARRTESITLVNKPCTRYGRLTGATGYLKPTLLLSITVTRLLLSRISFTRSKTHGKRLTVDSTGSWMSLWRRIGVASGRSSAPSCLQGEWASHCGDIATPAP